MNAMYIVSFNSTHHAIRTEKILNENTITCTTLPTPREITASCGISIRFLFEEVNANRICACHDVNNPNSGKVMMKCGMKYEGTLRSADRNNQGICDVSYYSLLKSER